MIHLGYIPYDRTARVWDLVRLFHHLQKLFEKHIFMSQQEIYYTINYRKMYIHVFITWVSSQDGTYKQREHAISADIDYKIQLIKMARTFRHVMNDARALGDSPFLDLTF